MPESESPIWLWKTTKGGGVVKRYFAWYVYGNRSVTAYGLLGDGADDHDATLRAVIDSTRLAA